MGTEYHENVFTNLKKLKNEKPQEVEFIDSDYELVDSFDENDNLVEKGILRKDIEEERVILRAVDMWILDKNNNVLLEKRSKYKKSFPNMIWKILWGEMLALVRSH